MSNLLDVVRLQGKSGEEKGKIPLMVDDIGVNPETAPYLVSSTKDLVWIEKAHPGNKIKAAVRHGMVPGEIFWAVIEVVAARSRADQWGSVLPYTAAGLKAATDYLDFYGLIDMEVLVPLEGKDKPKRPYWLSAKVLDLPIRPCSWIPDGWVVLVPRDRSFVGTIGHLTNKDAVVIVHNASRGIAILNGV